MDNTDNKEIEKIAEETYDGNELNDCWAMGAQCHAIDCWHNCDGICC